MSTVTLRVRSQIGTWRLGNVSLSDNFRVIRERLQKEHNAVFKTDSLSMDAGRTVLLTDEMTIREVGLRNGDMLYADVDEAKIGAHEQTTLKKKITKDGQIMVQDVSAELQQNGFRPGMLPLRDMKMKWTLAEFMSLDSQFTYKISAQEKSICTLATLDSSSVNAFQSYMRRLDFRSIRIGYLYGKFNEDNSVRVEAVYEPPQEPIENSFRLLPDLAERKVNAIVEFLGLKKVGWIFAHPPREKGFYFAGPEVLFAAEQQLEVADGIADTPFVTVKVTVDDKAQSVIEAFQVSKQCMEMVAEGVISPSSNLGSCSVNSTFTAIVEGKESKEIDNNFFLTTVPIKQFDSQFLTTQFPPANRVDVLPNVDHLKRQLSKAGTQGWSFVDLLADFHLLLFLADHFSLPDDISLICAAIVNREEPLNEGHQILIRSLAGLDI